MRSRDDILFPELEREMLRMGRVEEENPAAQACLDEDVRLAVLFSRDAALVPAPGFFETTAGYTLVRRFAPSVERGQLALLGSGGHPSDYADRKLSHWAGDSVQLDLYSDQASRRMAALDGRGWRPKRSSTDAELTRRWQDAVEAGVHPLLPVWLRAGVQLPRSQTAVGRLLEQLEGRAMVIDNIIPLVPARVAQGLDRADIHELRLFLASGFFSSYVGDANALPLVDSRFSAAAAVATSGTADAVAVRRLSIVLDAIGLNDLLLRQLSHSELAQLVDTAVWQSVRPDLLQRAQSSVMFDAEELVALRRLSGPRALPEARRVGRLEIHLERVAMALRRPRRRPGTSRIAGQPRLFDTDGALFMGGTHFHGKTTVNGSVINIEGRGELDAGTAPLSDVLAATLPQVLNASSEKDAERLLGSLEALLSSRDVTPTEIAQVVQDQFGDDVNQARPAVRGRLMDLGTSATAGVIAQGIMLGIKALVGT